jgi:ABC-type branched-subunit amino acid transport system ATPase component
MQPVLQLTNIRKNFGGIEVLKGVSTDVRHGRVTALIGSNGAGKSTLLNIVSGLIRPNAGCIVLDGKDITRLGAYARARHGVARTFQHPRSFRSLTVLQSVVLGGTPPRDEGLLRNIVGAFARKNETREVTEARGILETCRLGQHADTFAADLSYGEQKLLMLAQTLALRGQLLCFDELCAGLEGDMIHHIAKLFRAVAADGGTLLFIEHNLKLVRELADWVVFLHLGTVFREGETEEVLSDPDVVRLYLGQ